MVVSTNKNGVCVFNPISATDHPPTDYFQPLFHSSVMGFSDLKVGMRVTGRVENVTSFGAFCDIGVHHNAYIPRQLYPQATGARAGDMFTLRLGDRVTAIVQSLEPGNGCRIQLGHVQLSPAAAACVNHYG